MVTPMCKVRVASFHSPFNPNEGESTIVDYNTVRKGDEVGMAVEGTELEGAVIFKRKPSSLSFSVRRAQRPMVIRNQ